MKSLESTAFIGGFISAHYVELYIKRSWKPPGSPTVKRRFQIRKTRASNISSLCLHLHSFLPLSPCLPLCFSPRKCLLFASRSFRLIFGRSWSVKFMYVWNRILPTGFYSTQNFVSRSQNQCEWLVVQVRLLQLFIRCIKATLCNFFYL